MKKIILTALLSASVLSPSLSSAQRFKKDEVRQGDILRIQVTRDIHLPAERSMLLMDKNNRTNIIYLKEAPESDLKIPAGVVLELMITGTSRNMGSGYMSKIYLEDRSGSSSVINEISLDEDTKRIDLAEAKGINLHLKKFKNMRLIQIIKGQAW